MRISAKAVRGLLKDAASSSSADYAPRMGAALSYYTLFSIAPLLLVVIAVEPTLRRRHPFGSLGVAFIAGVAVCAAQSLAVNHRGAIKRRLP